MSMMRSWVDFVSTKREFPTKISSSLSHLCLSTFVTNLHPLPRFLHGMLQMKKYLLLTCVTISDKTNVVFPSVCARVCRKMLGARFPDLEFVKIASALPARKLPKIKNPGPLKWVGATAILTQNTLRNGIFFKVFTRILQPGVRRKQAFFDLHLPKHGSSCQKKCEKWRARSRSKSWRQNVKGFPALRLSENPPPENPLYGVR